VQLSSAGEQEVQFLSAGV